MRLATFSVDQGDRAGAPQGDLIVDLERSFAAARADGWVGSERTGVQELPGEMKALLRTGAVGIEAARSAVSYATSLPDRGTGHGLSYQLSAVRLLAPVIGPGKILCTGLNYWSHAREGKFEPPKDLPFTFAKLPENVRGPGAQIRYPAVTMKLDAEIELVVVIGKEARNVPEDEALDYVAGYTIGNDITARDVQSSGDASHRQFTLGKNCEDSAPLGPHLVTADEIPDPQNLRMTLRVNEETWQDASTAEMIFPVARLVSTYSRFFPLFPGDLIFTGTPAGVGAFHVPPRFLNIGDVMKLEIEGIGILENQIAG
jgi:acylpyruvate hydrolase